MKTIILMTITLALLASTVAAAECSLPGIKVSANPDQSIIVCDDPQDNTCEQDFESLCPSGYHLCTADEYNTGNDEWEGTYNNWLLGEIQCRDGGGAGHYTLQASIGNPEPYSNDIANNKVAGSSLPQCPANYGCNEKQYHALCCQTMNGDEPVNDIPEFSLIGATIIIASMGVLVWRRRK